MATFQALSLTAPSGNTTLLANHLANAVLPALKTCAQPLEARHQRVTRAGAAGMQMLTLLVGVMLAGCGQKGPLYLPPEAEEVALPAASAWMPSSL